MHRYKVIKKLGDGSQGVAYLANDPVKSRIVVVKKLPSGSRSNEEMRLGNKIRHPNIIECYDAFEEEDFVYLVMNYAEGGDLESFLDCLRETNEPLPLPVALRWFTQIAAACIHCHGCQLIHRDIKPSNVFLSKDLNSAYLGDFGVAKQLGASKKSTSTFVGSPVWLAPEVVSGQAYDTSSDGWGLGCVLYELVTGKSPFDATNFAALVMRICSGEYDDIPSTVPEHVRNAISGLLTVDTTKRWSVAKVLASHEDFDVNLPLPAGFGVAAPKEGLKTWMDARSRDLDELEKFNTPSGGFGDEPQWGVPNKDVPNKEGLNTWMDARSRDLDELEKFNTPAAVGFRDEPRRGAPKEAPKEGLKTWMDARSRDLDELEKFNVPAAPEFKDPHRGAPKEAPKEGLKTWMDARSRDLDELERNNTPHVAFRDEPRRGTPKDEPGMQTWMDETLQQLDEFEQILGKEKRATPVTSPIPAPSPTPSPSGPPKVPTSRPPSKTDQLHSNRAKRQLVEEPSPAQIALQKQHERESRREKDLQELRMRMKEGRKEAAKDISHVPVDVRVPNGKVEGPPLVPSGRRQSPQLASPHPEPPQPPSQPTQPHIPAGRRRSPVMPPEHDKSPPTPPQVHQEKDTRAAAAADKRLKQREEMLALIQRQRNQARQNGASEVNVEIVLPANLRNLPENRL